VLRPIIHVGFGHSGTTSLQVNVFTKRPEFFYAGIPYGELGGIFSCIKYQDIHEYDPVTVRGLCEQLIFEKMRRDQRLLISDETFVDQPAIYYTPAMIPAQMVAMRLREQFGACEVLFTLRNQYRYVVSNYLVLKRNYASLAHRVIEPFDDWFAGNQTQVRNLFLRNLDVSQAINVYQHAFGRDAVHVLPLELITEDGTASYLSALGAILGVRFSEEEIRSYVALNVSPPHDIVLNDEQRIFIQQRSGRGNALIAREFNLPLREYGYPMPDDAEPGLVSPTRSGGSPSFFASSMRSSGQYSDA